MRNPYPGLRPFRTDEEHLFFGREQQVDRMIAKLAERRFLAVVGGSGSGKSSLVNCGLRPALHRGYMAGAGANWRMAQFRPGSDPIGALARALAAPGVLFDEPLTGALSGEELVDSTLRLGSLGLVQMAEQADLPPGTQLLVVADQFEELFRFGASQNKGDSAGGDGEEVAFVRLLLEAAAQTEVPIYVVLTMRSDFLGDCARFQGLPEAMNESQYLVPRLTREQIRAAICGPAQVRGQTVSPVLVTRLLNDVGDNPDQLSVLQHALNRTWAYWEHHRAMEGELNLDDYQQIGCMADALNRHAKKAYDELPNQFSRHLCEKVFKALTDTSSDGRGIRRMTRLDNLCEITNATVEQLQPVFDAFRKPSRSFLMPPQGEALGGHSDIDISHESLMRLWTQLRQWVDQEAQDARTFRELRDKGALRELRDEATQEDGGSAVSLYQGPELEVALSWRARTEPNPAWAALYGGGFDAAMNFLDDSNAVASERKAASQASRRVRTAVVGGLLIALATLVALWLPTVREPEGFRKQRELVEPFAGVFLVLLAWPIWSGRRKWQLRLAHPIATQPSGVRRALAGAFDIGIGVGLFFLVVWFQGMLRFDYLGYWAPGFALLAYLLFCDAIRFRYCRSLGKIAFDLRPVNLFGPDLGHIGMIASARRNTSKIVALVAVVLVGFISLFLTLGTHWPTWTKYAVPALVCLTGLWLVQEAGSRLERRWADHEDLSSPEAQSRRRTRAGVLIALSAVVPLLLFLTQDLSEAFLLWAVLVAPTLIPLVRGQPLVPSRVIDAESEESRRIDRPPRYAVGRKPSDSR